MSWWNSKPKPDEPISDEIINFLEGVSCPNKHISDLSPPPRANYCIFCGEKTSAALFKKITVPMSRWDRVCKSIEFVRYLDKPEKKVPKSSAKYEAWLSEVEASLRRPLYRTEIELAAGLYTQPATPKEAAKTIRERRKK